MSMNNQFIVARTYRMDKSPAALIADPDIDEPQDLFLRHIQIEFLLLDNIDEEDRLFAGEDVGQTAAILHGTIILGQELSLRGEDFWEVCDDCSADLEAFAVEVEREESIQDIDPTHSNVLYIDELEISANVIDSGRLQELFDMIPNSVFLLYNVWPELMGYLIASKAGYYESAAKSAKLDPRSVDGYSPLLFTENGFKLSASANALFSIPER